MDQTMKRINRRQGNLMPYSSSTGSAFSEPWVSSPASSAPIVDVSVSSGISCTVDVDDRRDSIAGDVGEFDAGSSSSEL